MEHPKIAERLTDIQARYKTTIESYNNYVRTSEHKKETFVDFEERFNNMLAELVPVSAFIYGKRTRHDDRASSAVKSRICRSIFQGSNTEYEKESSWAKVESFAAASEEYKEFLEDRAFWYESFETIEGMQESIKAYLTAITHRIKL